MTKSRDRHEEKCDNCSYYFHQDDLKEHEPTGHMICDSCMVEYLAVDAEAENPSVDMKDGVPVEQYWLGYRIVPVLHRTGGMSDFFVYDTDKQGQGRLHVNTTVEELRKVIEGGEPVSAKKLSEEQVLECAWEYLDINPNPDRVHDIAKRMDMEYDEESGMYIDHEGIYDMIQLRRIRLQTPQL